MSEMMLAAALEYAQRGWRVLPLHTPLNGGCSCGKPECSAIGKHPRIRKGLSGATTDKSQLRVWWRKWPDANIGILTGSESKALVVDTDNSGGEHGSENLSALTANVGGMPETLTAITGSGEHLYFQHPGISVKNSTGKLAEGVDIKADGGYAHLAPAHQLEAVQRLCNTGSVRSGATDTRTDTMVLELLSATGVRPN
jgi:putative DNA primase/helicase